MDHPATDGQPPHSAGEQGAASSGRGLRKVSQRSLVIGALGVVFGDIGTSPLYSMRECFLHGHVDAGASANVIGVLSLIIWSLIVIICIKYLIYISWYIFLICFISIPILANFI